MSEQPIKQTIETLLRQVKPLTLDQYEDRVAEARNRIKEMVGEKPTKKQFQRERRTLFTGIEYLMLALLIVLFVFSVLHVFTWTRKEAIASYGTINLVVPETGELSPDNAGITIPKNEYVIAHQISVLGVTELGMIALSIYHIYRRRFVAAPQRQTRRNFLANLVVDSLNFVKTYFYLFLAAACGIVVLMANLSSGFNTLVSFLVPLLTISLSELFARLFAERYAETVELEKKYEAAVSEYEQYTADPTSHPHFQRVLSGYIQDWYRRNQAYKHIPWNPAVLNWLSAREKYAHSIHVSDAQIFERMVAEGQMPPLAAETSNSLSPTPQPASSPKHSEALPEPSHNGSGHD